MLNSCPCTCFKSEFWVEMSFLNTEKYVSVVINYMLQM